MARKKPLQVRRSRRLGGEAETVAFADDRDRRLGRAEQDDFVLVALPAERRDAPVFGPGQAMGGQRQSARVRFRRAAVLGRNDDRREPTERRQAAEAPLLRLFSIEPLGVAGHERCDDRMVRLPGLQKRVARLVVAPRAAGRLAQKLERALGRARIGVGETDVGVDNADKGQKRKVMPFGDELRADDEVVGAARRCIELAAQRLDPAWRVGGQDERADVGKEDFRLLGQALDARSAGGERVGLVALRAKMRPALDMAAMMANEDATETVLDQPSRAIGAFEAMAASSGTA